MAHSLVLIFHKEQDGRLFEQILLAIRKWYTPVSLPRLEEILMQGQPLENICHISFDDGDYSFYQTVFPLLKKHAIPASLFVSPRVISTGSNYWFQEMRDYNEPVLREILSEQLQLPKAALKPFPFMAILNCLTIDRIHELIAAYRNKISVKPLPGQNINAAQLREIDASGLVTIGAHTQQHPILKNETAEVCREEISASVKELAALLGHPISYFAYPNGRPGIDFGEREKNYLRENGIRLAFSTELGHLSHTTDRLSIPRMGFARMGLSPANPLIKFRLQLGNHWKDIKSIGKPTEEALRKKIFELLQKN